MTPTDSTQTSNVSSVQPQPNSPLSASSPSLTFRALALRVAGQVCEDLHINLSGAVFFVVLAIGILHPAAKEQCAQIVALAGTYLFSAAKQK